MRRLDLFGSAVSESFDPARSDLDSLEEFEALTPEAYADAWFGLLEALEALYSRHIDLVTPRSIRNPFFAAKVHATRQNLLAA